MDDVTNRTMLSGDAPAGVEALLRAAARFTPDEPVPNTLAFRALERAGLLPGTFRRRRPAGFRPLALAGGALAAAAALLSFTRASISPAVTARPDYVLSTNRTATALLSRNDAFGPAPGNAAAAGVLVAQAASETRPPRLVSRAGRIAAAPARVRRNEQAAPRTAASLRRRGAARRPVFAASVLPPPKALWQTRTVEQENYGLLAPAWVTFHAPAESPGGADEGEIVGAMPVVVDLPLSGGDTRIVAAADIVPVDYDPHHP